MLKPTKHATTNYRMLKPFLDAADAHGGHARFISGGYMPLVVENLGYTVHDGQVYSVTHYGELNGDLMRDPDVTFSVNRKAGTVDPLTFQNDYVGRYNEVYCTNDAGQECYRPRLRTELDCFLWQWLRDFITIGYDPANIDRSRDEAEDEANEDEAAEIPDGKQLSLLA